MNRAGVLLDTGPLVALLSKHDNHHARARQLFAACSPPLRCCEAVVTEACFLMRKVHPGGPSEVVALARKGVYASALARNDPGLLTRNDPPRSMSAVRYAWRDDAAQFSTMLR